MQTVPSLRALGRHFVGVLSAFTLIAVLAGIPLSAVDYKITAASPDTVDLGNVGLQPGDTVFIEAHTRQKLIIQNLAAGTAGQPIRITNLGGQFVIDTTTTDKGLHFYNCRHFVLRGTPSPGNYDYGIKLARVSQAGAIGLAFVQGSTDFEVSHIEIGHAGFAGVMAKSDGLDRTQFTMRNVSFHHLYIHDTGGEAIYVGNSAYHDTTVNAHEIHGVKIYDNLIVNAGWDGIQLGCATQDAAIYRNRIVGYGAADLTAANHYAQNEGMRINPGTAAVIHDNWIEGGNPGCGSGIFANPHDDSVYYNNVIIAPGESGIVISADYAMNPGTTIALLNNTIISPVQHGIEFWSLASSGNVAANNVIAAPGGEFVHKEYPAVDLTSTGFLHVPTVAEAGFRNPVATDYHLAAGSPAIDAGADVAAFGVAADHDGVTRPFGAATDKGAYEYYASPTGVPLIVAQPTSQSVRVGADVTFKVIVAGDEPLSYVWSKDGNPIAGATSATLSLPAVSLADQGSYAVAITNALGSALSATATLTVTVPPPEPPFIVIQPSSRTVTAGADVTFSVVASGSGSLAYQWKKAGSPIASAITPTLNLTSVANTAAGSYTVEITNAYGAVTSNAALLTVNAPPSAPTVFTVTNLVSDATVTPHVNPTRLYTHRVDINATASVTVNGVPFAFGTGNGGGAQPALNYTLSSLNNSIANFNATATGEIRPVLTTRSTNTNSASYALTLSGLTAGKTYTFALFNSAGHGPGRNWYRLSQNIDGTTFDLDFSAGGVSSSRLLTSTYTPIGTSVTFTFTRLDGMGSPGVTNTTSWIGFAGFVNYELPASPTIVLPPQTQVVDATTTVTFTVDARGEAPLAYQWLKDGAPLAGATGATLVLNNVQTTDSGGYAVTVTNTHGSATSAAATLTVNSLTAPTIVTQPTSKSVEVGSATNFTVSATGTAPLSYQWAKDGTALPGATAATLSLTNIQLEAAGSYSVTVTNNIGSITSNPATLTVTLPPPTPPTIATQPANRTVDINLNATFTVVATGTAPLSYQWAKEGAAISGATTATLTLPAVQPSAAGSYTVTVSNAIGSITSNAATLTVNVPRQTAQRATSSQFDLNYLLYLPTGYEPTSDDTWPLLVFLHGYGERSTPEANPMDPIHLNKLRVLGPPLRIQQGTEFPFIVVSPQCAGDWWQGVQLEAFITDLQQRYRVDRTRIYLTGLSMGGFGVYDLAQRQPSRYAAIAPISAAPQVDATNSAAAPRLRDMPLWAFHGANDPLYSVVDLQNYLNLIRNVGGDPRVTIYTTSPGNVHDSWVPAYADDALYAWLLTHTAQPPAVTSQPQPTSAPLGGSATFTVVASGRWPFTYQWMRDGAAISGATNATFTLDNLTFADAGDYAVRITNGVGSVTSASAALLVTKVPATVTLHDLVQAYDGQPKLATATTDPAGLTVQFTYNGSSTPPTLPGSYAVVATIDDPSRSGSASAQLVINAAALVRHAPVLNGAVDGSIQLLLPENTTLNGNAWVSGDLLAPGTPTVTHSGQPTYGGTQDGSGASSPSNYTITLNGNALLRHVVRRVDPPVMPVVAAPPPPAGTVDVTINQASQTVGNWSSVRNLTLNDNVGQFAVPPGVYGSLTANGGSGLILGISGATEPAVYALQGLILNGGAQLQVIGPVVLTLAQGTSLNGSMGSAEHHDWLLLQISSGGLTLNGSATLSGTVVAPTGTVILNGNSTLAGQVSCDRLIVNGQGLLIQSP